jgi:hypothetical protein
MEGVYCTKLAKQSQELLEKLDLLSYKITNTILRSLPKWSKAVKFHPNPNHMQAIMDISQCNAMLRNAQCLKTQQ